MVRFEIETHGPMLELIWSGKGVRMNERRRVIQKNINGKKKSIIVNTDEYNQFIEEMAMLFRINAGGHKITGQVLVIIGISAGKKRRIMDIDAFEKQVLDSLEKSGVVENDKYIRHVFLRDLGKGETEMDTIVVWAFGATGNEKVFWADQEKQVIQDIT